MIIVVVVSVVVVILNIMPITVCLRGPLLSRQNRSVKVMF